MIRQDPESSCNVVADLSVLQARIVQEIIDNSEADIVTELSCQLVFLNHGHKGEGQSMHRYDIVGILLRKPEFLLEHNRL